MPELPEVETVVRGLRPALVGRRILAVDQRRADLRFPFPVDFARRLEGRRVEAIDRRAKYILARLDDGTIWLAHLGMTGRFLVGNVERITSGQAGHNSGWAVHGAHDHLAMTIEGGVSVTYNDVRRFGFMDLIAAADLAASSHLKGLGPEPLSEDFSPAYLAARFAGKKTPIKAALLDQAMVAGLGNIYVCEALWRAGIAPKRLAGEVSRARLNDLVPAIKEILHAAIAAGGSSLRDFVHADGELGYFQHSWDAYDREGEICRRPGCGGVMQRIVQSGRSTFYCAKHQR